MILCSLFQDIPEGPEKDQYPGKYKTAHEDPGGPGKRTQIGLSRGLSLHFIQMVKAGHIVKKTVHVGIVHGLLPPDRFGHAFDEPLNTGVTKVFPVLERSSMDAWIFIL